MRKFLLVLAVICTLPFYAQRRVAAKVQELGSNGADFKSFSPLVPAEGTKDYPVVENETYATLNTAVLKNIYNNKPETLTLTIPYQGSQINISLYKVNIFAEGFHADTDKEKDFAYKQGVYYRGIINNDNTSLASFSFFENEMAGIVSNQQYNNIVVGKLKKEHNFSEYIIYSDSELNVANSFNCLISDEIKEGRSFGKKSAATAQSTETLRCVGIYFEVDFNMYQENFSNQDLTANWLTALFNSIQTLYANDGIDIALKSFFIWTSFDPYLGSDAEDKLFGFLEEHELNGFDGDLGQLVGEDAGGLGGLAFLNGVCNAPINVSYVDVNDNFLADLPQYSWSVQACTHEFGHQLGSPHTHACAWNGNNTAIDGCFDTEGGCSPGPIPPTGGTIMSYCHLSQVGVNLANGFGPQPTALMTNVVNTANCLATTCESIICQSGLSNLSVTSSSSSNFIASWDDAANTTGFWDVMVHEASATQGDMWNEVGAQSVTLQGLQPNTYYVLKVRSVCEQGVSQIEEILFATDADWCEGQIFTDTGGATANYSDNQQITRTFTPTEEGKVIRVTFTSFSIEQDFDFLRVYNGAGTNAPLIGNFTGVFIQNQITSTAADGSLTFEFTSDEIINAGGWVATVECINAVSGVNDNAFSNFMYYPNPATSTINISAAEEITEVKVYAVSGQLLFTRQVNATQTAIDISALANGVYFFKASNGTKETNFRVVKQ